MKVVYLSAVRGHGAATSNMIIMALMAALNNRYKSILFQCGEESSGLDQYLLGSGKETVRDRVSELEYPFYYGKGIDALLKKAGVGREIQRDRKSLTDCCYEVIPGDCFLLPSTTRKNRTLYHSQMNAYIYDILSWCDREFDFTFIDNKTENQELFNRVNGEADLIVINTSQAMQDFRQAVYMKKALGSKPSIIVIGRYETRCQDNYERLRRQFKLRREEVFAVRYDKDFLNAMLTGYCAEYMRLCHAQLDEAAGAIRNIRNTLFEYNEQFSRSVQKYTEGVIKKVQGGMTHSQ